GTFGVNINLRSRQNEGTVELRHYDRARENTAHVLRAMINPHTGLPLFRDVHNCEDIYAGAALATAPDLIVAPYDERYLPLGEPDRAAHVHRRLQSGWHRGESFWGGAGPAFEGAAGGEAQARDILPTIASMLGVKMDEKGVAS